MNISEHAHRRLKLNVGIATYIISGSESLILTMHCAKLVHITSTTYMHPAIDKSSSLGLCTLQDLCKSKCRSYIIQYLKQTHGPVF